jgi:O-methyltransferase involved in polyketide biosynthesis
MQRMIDNILNQGYEQILVLGAGFDHLGLHYSQKGLPCFEVDTPYMAKQKKKFLQEQYPQQSHPEIIELLLSNNRLAQIISDHTKIDPHKKTIVVAEGFFDYLRSDTVQHAIKDIQEYFSHKPALISTHFALDELSPFRRKIFQTSVQLAGEPLQLEISMTAFEQSLSDLGYEIRQIHGSQEIREDIQDHIDTTMPILDGFYLFIAK